MATGEPVYAEASVRGKKREAVVQCALNACRILDAQDMLRNPTQGGPVHKVIAVPYRWVEVQFSLIPSHIVYLPKYVPLL